MNASPAVRRAVPLLIGLFAGAFLSAVSARAQAGEPSVAPSPAADAVLGEVAWRLMTDDQKELVALVARDAARALDGAAFESLTEPRQAALRGYAMRVLGVDDRALRRGLV